MLYLKKLNSIILIVILGMVTGSVSGDVYAEPESPVTGPDCPARAQDTAQPRRCSRRLFLAGIREPAAAGAAVRRRVSEHAGL